MPLCLRTEWDGCLPCSRGGKLGPHKGDPTLYPHERPDHIRGTPLKTNKQTTSYVLQSLYNDNLSIFDRNFQRNRLLNYRGFHEAQIDSCSES